MNIALRLSPAPIALAALLIAGTPAASLAQTSTANQTKQSAKPAPVNPAAAPAPDRAAAYYHYGMAKMYEDQATTTGRQDLATQAIEQYKLALNADPNSRDLEDGLANLYFKLGRIREAVSSAQEQVARHPEDPDAHILLGRVYLRSLGDGSGPQSSDMLQAAIKEYETIARLKPDDLETHLLLGQLYGLNHDSAKAEQQFEAAQRIDPNSEEVVLSMARQYTEQGNFEKASQTLAAVPAGDRSERMDLALAGIYDQLKKYKLSAEAYKAALDQDPENMDAKRGLANALIASGQNDAAAKLYGDLVTADPNDAESLIRAADLQRQKGHYDQALATLKKAAVLAPDSLELKYNEALVYDALGRYNDSIQVLKEMLASSAHTDGKYTDEERGNRALLLDRLGIVDREVRHTADAVAAYQEMMTLGGDFQARGAGGLIDTYRDAHDYVAATRIAAETAKAMPANRPVQLAYARQLADTGKTDEALKLANAQLNGTPDDRDVYFAVADIDSRARRFAEASAALDKVEAMSTKPDDKIALDAYRGTLADKRKMYDEAEAQYKKALALDPQNAEIQNDYGYLLAERGVRLDEAVTMLKKAVTADPQNGAFLDSLGYAYFKQGQYALAEEYARKAAERTPTDPTVLDHLGEIYEKNGKLQLAAAEWQRSLQEYSTSLAPDADPIDVAKVQHKLEGVRVKLAHSSPTK